MFHKTVCRWAGAAAVLAATTALAGTASAQVDLSGKTVEFVIPFSESGGTARWANVMAPFLSQHLPGNPTVVVGYRPGGGSTTGANWFQEQTTDDGTLIFGTSGSTQFPYLLGDPRVRYEYNDWKVLLVSGTGGVAYLPPETAAKMNGLDVSGLRDENFIWGVQSATGLDLVPNLAWQMLGLNVESVQGIEGRGDGRLMFERGEANIDYQTSSSYIQAVQPLVDGGLAVPIMSWGALDDAGNIIRDPSFPDIPTFAEVCDATPDCETEGLAWDAWVTFFTAGFPANKMLFLPGTASQEMVDAYPRRHRARKLQQRQGGRGLVPTLIFGIPGSASMAVFLGGLALLGMTPGPAMVRNDLDITYTIVWSLALANVVGAGLCVLLSGQIARLTTIRFTLLAPFLFMMIAFAAFQSRMSFGDLIALVFVGVIGILLRRFDYSRPAFLIGFVLSTQAEQFVNMATQIGSARFRRSFEAGIDYIVTPITVTLLVLTVLSIVIGIRQSKNIRENIATHTGTKRAPLVFLAAVTAYAAIATVDAAGVSRFGDKVFPLTVGIVTLLGCLALFARMMLKPETDDVFIDMETGGDDGEAPHSLWGTLAWFFGLLALTGLFGFVIALAIFMLAFFRVRAQVSWGQTLTLSALAILLICGLAWVLNRDFPPGLLQEFVRLPWPLT